MLGTSLLTDEWWHEDTAPKLGTSYSPVASKHNFFLQSENPVRKTRGEQSITLCE